MIRKVLGYQILGAAVILLSGWNQPVQAGLLSGLFGGHDDDGGCCGQAEVHHCCRPVHHCCRPVTVHHCCRPVQHHCCRPVHQCCRPVVRCCTPRVTCCHPAPTCCAPAPHCGGMENKAPTPDDQPKQAPPAEEAPPKPEKAA